MTKDDVIFFLKQELNIYQDTPMALSKMLKICMYKHYYDVVFRAAIMLASIEEGSSAETDNPSDD